jgi:1,4-dihydroxy-2-naphthoate octaprenyltransferase
MNIIKKWLIAVRAPFFTGIAMPIFIGAALAYYETGQFHWGLFLVTLVGGLFAHAGANLSNDYFDHKTTDDDININYTPFSGGSRTIQNKMFSARAVFWGAMVCYLVALAAGIYLTAKTPGYWILIFAAAGFMGGFLYTAGRYAFSYIGLGELAILVNFGILPVMGSYFVQTGHFSWSSFWSSFPIGFLITAILYINQYPDYDADKTVHKRNLVVRAGKKLGQAGYYFLILGNYGMLILAVIIGSVTPYALIALLSIPVAIKTLKTFSANYNKIKELIPAQGGTIITHSLVGILMTFGYILGVLMGK